MISDALSPSRSQRLSNYIKHLPNLVAYYPLNETDGSTAYNKAPATLGTLNGSVTGATIGQQGKVGKAYSFDGVGDYIEIADNPIIRFNATDFTVLAFTKRNGDQPNSPTAIVDKETGVAAWGFWMDANAPSKLWYWTSGSSNRKSTIAVSNNTWNLVGLTVQYAASNNDTVSFYINGTADTITGVQNVASHTAVCNIGMFRNHSGAPLKAWLQHVMMFNRALSAAEILKLAQLAGFT